MTKTSSWNLGDYGSFVNMLKTIVAGDGFNDTNIREVELLPNKQVKFYFSVSSTTFHGFNKNEVVNVKDKPYEEFEIIGLNENYLLCQYYDDGYTIQAGIGAKVLCNSSLGFTDLGVTNDQGRYTIQTEDGGCQYHFYDVEDSSFTNTQEFRVVGLYMSTPDNSIRVPSELLNDINNDTLVWNNSTYPNAKRRCIANLLYHKNNLSKWHVIGNGNTFYIIITHTNASKKSCTYVFGRYKSYSEYFENNYLMTSADFLESGWNSSSAISAAIYSNKRAFGFYYSADMYMNAAVNIPVYSQAGGGVVTNHRTFTFLLSGYSGEHCSFSPSPQVFYGSYDSGKSNMPYPNVYNKMFLSGVNVMNSTIVMGEMPFGVFIHHSHNSIPIVDLGIAQFDFEGVKKRLFMWYSYQSAAPTVTSVQFLDITPNNYNNYD